MQRKASWFLVMLLAGCASTGESLVEDASRAGNVGITDITQGVAPAARMVLAENESFLMPLDDRDNAVPVYPASLLARQLPPQVVCLRVSIDDDGGVMSSAPIVKGAAAEGADCPGVDATHAAFFEAAQAAVARWRFDPALRCVFPDAKTKANVEASCSGGQEVRTAVSLAYRFVFEQHDGRGSVRVGR